MNYYIANITIQGGIEIADNCCDFRDPAYESHIESADIDVGLGIWAETQERAEKLAKEWRGCMDDDGCWLTEIDKVVVGTVELAEEDCEDAVAEGYDEENIDYGSEPY